MSRFLVLCLLFITSTVWCATSVEPFVANIPGQGWNISFKAPALLNYMGQSGKDSFQFRANGGNSGFNLSAYVEAPQNKTTSHTACFEHYWPLAKRNPMIAADTVKIAKQDSFVKVSYDLKLKDGSAGRNVNYYFVFAGRWIDVHISLFPSGPEDEAVIAAFEKSLSYQKSKTDAP